MTTIERVLVGAPRELVKGEPSAIWKEPVHGRVAVGSTGLRGDQQAYRDHGGAEKALLHYAAEHYREWARRFPATARAAAMTTPPDQSGAEPLPQRTLFGENLVTYGMTEETVCLGDRYMIGDTVVVEVTQARQPCWKLGVTAEAPEIPRLMQDHRNPGWYYRVVTPGTIAAGDSIELVGRPLPDWSLARMLRGFYGTPADREVLTEMAALPLLSQEWRGIIDRRLKRGEVEDWDRRLYR